MYLKKKFILFSDNFSFNFLKKNLTFLHEGYFFENFIFFMLWYF